MHALQVARHRDQRIIFARLFLRLSQSVAVTFVIAKLEHIDRFQLGTNLFSITLVEKAI